MLRCAICGEEDTTCFSNGKIKVEKSVYDICFLCASNWSAFKELSQKDKFELIDESLYDDLRKYLATALNGNLDVSPEVKDMIISAIVDSDLVRDTAKTTLHRQQEFVELHSSMMLTTGYDFQGYQIIKYIQVISGETVLGTGFLSEFSASVADMFGMTSELFSDKLLKAKSLAQEKLLNKACTCGANAIIGLDFDYITLYANILGVIANGTAVYIEKLDA